MPERQPLPDLQLGLLAAKVPDPNDPGNAQLARNLSPVGSSQIGAAWRICRRMAFTQGGGDWDAWIDEGPDSRSQPAAGGSGSGVGSSGWGKRLFAQSRRAAE